MLRLYQRSVDVLISGSSLASGGDATIAADGNVNITVAQTQTDMSYGKNALSATTHTGSEIKAVGSVNGSDIEAGGRASLAAAGDVAIAEATDTLTVDVQGRSKSGGFFHKARSIVTQPFDGLRKGIDAAETVFQGRGDKVLNIFAFNAFGGGDMGSGLAVRQVAVDMFGL